MSLLPELNPNLIPSNLMGRVIGTLQNPVTSGLELQVPGFQEGKSKAQLFIVDGADIISNWTDLSSNDNDAAQGTASRQPLYLSNGINGFPAVDFTNVTAPFLTLGTELSLTDGTAFAVFENTQDTGTAPGMILADLVVNNQFLRFDPNETTDGTLHIFDGSVDLKFNLPSSITNIPKILRSEVEVGVNKRISLNSFLKATGTYNGTMQADQVGRLTIDNAGNMSGKLGELIVYNRILTAAEIIKVEKYLSIKWKIPLVDLA